MARLVGVDLPREKRTEIALPYIFGIGLTRAHATLAATGVSPDVRVKDLKEPELAKLKDFIRTFIAETGTAAASGDCTWADFAEAIFQEAGVACRVRRIASTDYPTPDGTAIRDYIQAVEEMGFNHIMAYDHVIGANAATTLVTRT